MTSFNIEPILDDDKSWLRLKLDAVTTFLEENRQNIFYLFLFYVITIALFVERFIRKFTPSFSTYYILYHEIHIWTEQNSSK